MNKIFEQLLQRRGVGGDFLRPRYEQLADAFLLPDMKAAVERISRAVEQKEKILIYGDYDADGVTASVIMYDTLRLAGAEQIKIVLPDRFVDGYGMSVKLVEQAKTWGAQLVISVDCGSNNSAVIAELKENYIDTVVTDHHEILGDLPDAVAVVNPKRAAEGELRELCGAGVAFMVARGLVQAGRIESGREKWLMDLVLIGTVCDSMLLNRQNRILTYYGMKVLAKTKRVGLIELLRVAGVKKIDSEAIGFRIGPRLNAAGRMDSAKLALDLLMATSRVKAARLAQELEDLNSARKHAQQTANSEIEERGVGNDTVLVVVGDWHEGILGIIAGWVVERYKRPAFVLAQNGDVLKGSGRSFGDFNLAEGLVACRDSIIGGGGHAGACGLKLAPEKEDEFRVKINAYYKSLQLVNQERFLKRVADVEVGDTKDLSLDLIREMRELEPYGPGNLEPVFCVRNGLVVEAKRLGEEGKHLRLMVAKAAEKGIKLVAFYAQADWLQIEVGDRVDVWFNLVENEWNNLRSVEGRILKIVLASSESI